MKKQKNMRIISALITVIMLISNINFAVFAEGNDWSDVSRYYPFNSWAVDIGTKYNMIFLENHSRETKRVEVVNILYHVISKTNRSGSTSRSFSDISNLDENLKNKIIKVADANIISGYADGTFKPNNVVTRAEFVTMLDKANIIKETKKKSDTNFDDVIGHWAEKSINQISKFGIVSGKGENKFFPEATITPQEIFIILDRLVNQGCITKENLINIMKDTFACKQYTDKEKYLIETIYNKFDQVQNDTDLVWPYKKYYNPNNWEGLATYNDLLYVMYFSFPTIAERRGKLKSGETSIDRMKRYMIEIQGIEGNVDSHLTENFTMLNLLKALDISRSVEFYNTETWSKDSNFGGDKLVSMLEFSNTNELNRQEKGAVASGCVNWQYNNRVCFENNNMFFPIDAPVTRYMLNYLILKLQYRYGVNNSMKSNKYLEFFGIESKDSEFETNRANLPSNYYEYPFIMKGIPKEIYEKPYYEELRKDNNFVYHNSLDSYEKYRGYESQASFNLEQYYDTILNVNYTTFNVEDFVYKASHYGYAFEDSLRAYAQYVIDNKIILEGKACVIPGTMHIADIGCRVRTMIKFKVISADKRENLLYGDYLSFYNEQPLIMLYPKDEYYFCFESQLSGVVDYINGGIEEYRPMNYPIIEQLGLMSKGVNQLP